MSDHREFAQRVFDSMPLIDRNAILVLAAYGSRKRAQIIYDKYAARIEAEEAGTTLAREPVAGVKRATASASGPLSPEGDA